MPPEAKHVRPGPQPQALQLSTAAQLPGRPDELSHMGRQPVQVLQVVGIVQARERLAELLQLSLSELDPYGARAAALAALARHVAARALAGHA